ncbi:MAG: ATP12 family chaperone protein [Pseudolabrys sp.]
MRDIFTEIFENQPLDPREAARRGGRTALRKRFYGQAHVGDGPGAFALLLDGKPVMTPARRPLVAPSRALAEKLAAEWNAQEQVIDPGRMPLTRLANAVIDAVANAPRPVADEVAQYLGSDLLCYRADAPAGLVELQARHWDPVLAWARDALGARFALGQGVMHVTQPVEAITVARTKIPAEPWRLGAVSSITTLSGSGLLALALAHGALDADAAWAAAHADEDWQMLQWGKDQAALDRRAYRRAEFDAAVTVLRLT